MSKMGSLQQSMAALFTPESERVRKAQQDGATPSSVRSSGPAKQSMVNANGQMSDSLGNGHSPGGYEPLRQGKKGGEEANAEPPFQPGFQVEGATVPTFHPAGAPGHLIRLSSGFEKLLVAQLKVCEKASTLIVGMEAPERYKSQKRGKLLQGKSRGCILDHTQQLDPIAPPKDPGKDGKAA